MATTLNQISVQTKIPKEQLEVACQHLNLNLNKESLQENDLLALEEAIATFEQLEGRPKDTFLEFVQEAYSPQQQNLADGRSHSRQPQNLKEQYLNTKGIPLNFQKGTIFETFHQSAEMGEEAGKVGAQITREMAQITLQHELTVGNEEEGENIDSSPMNLHGIMNNPIVPQRLSLAGKAPQSKKALSGSSSRRR